MSGLRVSTNVVVTVVLSILLVAGAFVTYASGVVFDDSYRVEVALPEAGGILPDQQVTVMGVAVGQVDTVEVTEDGVLVTMRIQGHQTVPTPAQATVLRRSPIGEQALDIAPNEEGWGPAEPDSRIETTDITIAPEVAGLLRSTVDLFEAIAPNELATVVEEAAVALDGRGATLTRLNRDMVDFNRTMTAGLPEFERLLDTSEATLRVLREQRDTLRSVIGHSADLSDIFAEQRPNFDGLLDSGTPAIDQLDAFLLNTRANFGCVMEDLTSLNEMMLGPSTYDGANGPDFYASKLDEFERSLLLHTFFFQNGASLVGQADTETGMSWLRVLLILDEPNTAEFYPEFVPTPQTRPGGACVSEEFGRGVDAVRQPGVQDPHETAPPIDYQPQVDATHERVEPSAENQAEPVGDRTTSGAASGTDRGDGSTTPAAADRSSEQDAPATELDVRAGDDDLARSGRDLGLLVTIGVALIVLPLLSFGVWRLRRGSGNR